MVTIIGSGIAGMCTAIALHQAGIPAEIYEQRKTTGDDAGGQAHLGLSRTVAIPALTALGLKDEILAGGFLVRQVEIRDHTNQVLNTFQAAPEGNVGITRAELYRILHTALEDRGITIHYRRALHHITPQDTGVRLEFRDGTRIHTALVVGADGLRSTVRAHISDSTPGVQGPEYGRWWYAHGITDHIDTPTPPDTFVVIRNQNTQHAFGYLTLSNIGTRWWLRIAAPARHTMIRPDNPADRAELENLAPNDTAATIIRNATIDMSSYNADCIPPDQPWTDQKHLALVGDAIHACIPSSSQNVPLAAEDALTLARALRDCDTQTIALDRYERMRRNRAHRALIAGNPANGIDAGPEYPIDWNTPITDHLATTTEQQYRMPTETASVP
ncbi:FAD-dependent oxidoreductase [Sciscionella marina]|uniref:FAD-dependent oxidoreductase n=1 Tax=Sciscionella marina TaxID=508770 RepID=UPI0003815246|nr:NAD(P)/FAD-dependent oxidoreductase [Sciscionella marina]